MKESAAPYYVILTGSKNNAGDFLIKYRAKELFKEIRPDRDVLDVDAWKPFTEEQLKVINHSKALILMGGPSVQPNMYPGIYPLVPNLNEIRVPITMMGVGWKGVQGTWDESRKYRLSESSRRLLKRIANDKLNTSVRDFHTVNVLKNHGLNNVVMTGCPATYSLSSVGKDFTPTNATKRIGFSLGVSFLDSNVMKSQMKRMILRVREHFPESELIVAFHHSLDVEKLNASKSENNHVRGHREFASWLSDQEIKYEDISGSAENLINFYNGCDLHIGYRVHAHIFMTSIGKPTLLVAEDGRGKALPKVFGGLIVDGFEKFKPTNIFTKILWRVGLIDGFNASPNVVKEVIELLEYEKLNHYILARNVRSVVDNNFSVMKNWLQQLP